MFEQMHISLRQSLIHWLSLLGENACSYALPSLSPSEMGLETQQIPVNT